MQTPQPQTRHPFYQFMLEALRLSRSGFGHTMPNPCVGALLVKDDQILAQGFHAASGQDHAEVAALKDAAEKGVNPAECTLVVTLEPCNHQGKTPPCTQAILNAGIRKVIIGAADPNPQAAGGAEFLRNQGVQVETCVAGQECLDNIADFRAWQTTDLPYVILKLASTLDGRIATSTGHSKWISGPETLKRVHELRSCVQAVLIGGNTFYADNPQLTCRLDNEKQNNGVGVTPQPLAVIVSSRLPEADQRFNLLRERPEQTIFFTSTTVAASPKAEALRRLGARVWGLEYKTSASAKEAAYSHTGRPNPALGRLNLDLAAGFAQLRRECGVYCLLCEGGGKLGLNLLENQLVDEFRLHLSPKIVGDNEARPLFDGRHPSSIDDVPGLRFTGAELCGEDLLLQLRKSL